MKREIKQLVKEYALRMGQFYKSPEYKIILEEQMIKEHEENIRSLERQIVRKK